mgnify:CR=1 FL=1
MSYVPAYYDDDHPDDDSESAVPPTYNRVEDPVSDIYRGEAGASGSVPMYEEDALGTTKVGDTYQSADGITFRELLVDVGKIGKGRVGMMVRTTKKKGTRILSVSKDGLAARCGLLPKDRIQKINGEPIAGWSHTKVNAYMKKYGIETLTIYRPLISSS